jgi:carbon storage regulator
MRQGQYYNGIDKFTCPAALANNASNPTTPLFPGFAGIPGTFHPDGTYCALGEWKCMNGVAPIAPFIRQSSFLNNLSYQPKECGMLVLTRKQSEKIRIGDDITITVLWTKGKAVRLGIEAPAHINILRGELVFELAAEELERETAGADNTSESTPRQAAKASGHRQQSATHWPASPIDRIDSPETVTTPNAGISRKEGPISLAKAR